MLSFSQHLIFTAVPINNYNTYFVNRYLKHFSKIISINNLMRCFLIVNDD